MRTSLLLVPADERFVRRLQEEDLEVDPLLAQARERMPEVLEELLEELAAARPHDDGGARTPVARHRSATCSITDGGRLSMTR